jgi:cytochrome c peroxidase
MRRTSSLALLASTLIGTSTLIFACDDGDDSGSDPSTGGSSQGGTTTGGSSGASATGGTGGVTSGGTAGAPTGGSGGSGKGGAAGSSQGGSAGEATGGSSPGGAGGSGGEDDGGAGAGGNGQCDTGVSPAERTLLDSLGPLPVTVPADTTNQHADSAAARALGQRFFFDKAFSGPLGMDSDLGTTGQTGKVACSSCHLGESMEDHRSNPPQVSIAAGRHARNAPGLVNSSFYAWTNWAGRFAAQWELPLPVAENGVIMNGNRLAIAHRIAAKYKAEYEAVFGALDPELGTTSTRFPPAGKPKPVTDPPTADGAWELMASGDRAIVMRVFVNFGKALQAYTRKLVSRAAPFDDWMAGDCDAISASAKRGAALFVGKARCASCHSNTHFSDDSFHNLGVPQGVPPNPDQGRFADAVSLLNAPVNSANATYSDDPTTGAARLAGLVNPMPESARGAFRTPNLRGVAQTAPYMHSGQFATLEAVIDFYDGGGGTPVVGTRDSMLVPLGLSSGERADLVAFLGTLTGAAVPAEFLVDTSAAP